MSKLKFDYVKKYFEEQGCTLLETEYKNSIAKMRYVCSCGKESIIAWSNFFRGSRCYDCGHKKHYNNLRCDYDEVKKRFENNGLILLETEYIHSSTPMKYICKKGHISTITWNSLNRKKNIGCGTCLQQKQCDKIRQNYDYVKKYFEKQDCILLETEYKNSITKMRYVCKCGKESVIRWNHFFNKGSRCNSCKSENQRIRRYNPDRELVKNTKVIGRRCRAMLIRVLKIIKVPKEVKSEILLGYSRIDLRNHLMSHPDWDRVKNTNWSIDHIFPIKAFTERGITDVKLINCLENLRPMELCKNISKRDKYNNEEFELWLNKKLSYAIT
jgi:hypothetical protein